MNENLWLSGRVIIYGNNINIQIERKYSVEYHSSFFSVESQRKQIQEGNHTRMLSWWWVGCCFNLLVLVPVLVLVFVLVLVSVLIGVWPLCWLVLVSSWLWSLCWLLFGLCVGWFWYLCWLVFGVRAGFSIQIQDLFIVIVPLSTKKLQFVTTHPKTDKTKKHKQHGRTVAHGQAAIDPCTEQASFSWHESWGSTALKKKNRKANMRMGDNKKIIIKIKINISYFVPNRDKKYIGEEDRAHLSQQRWWLKWRGGWKSEVMECWFFCMSAALC